MNTTLPTNQPKNDLKYLRQQIRTGNFKDKTSGLMPSLLQGNLVILPSAYSQEFIEFCNMNSKPCPIIGYSAKGSPFIPQLGQNLDVRTDIPEYYIFVDGKLTATVTNIKDYWHNDYVAIILGCSYSFEGKLIAQGYSIRNIELKLNVSMYNTNIVTKATQHFSGNTVVSMRPFKPEQIEMVSKITAQFTKAHGAPIHIGDPSIIGIENINKPDYGDAVTILDDEVPVFWGCGVTSQLILKNAQLPIVITHVPGKMLITDITYNGYE